MNRIFRIIWSHYHREWVVTSELGQSKRERMPSRPTLKEKEFRVSRLALTLSLLLGMSSPLLATPDPYEISSGEITTPINLEKNQSVVPVDSNVVVNATTSNSDIFIIKDNDHKISIDGFRLNLTNIGPSNRARFGIQLENSVGFINGAPDIHLYDKSSGILVKSSLNVELGNVSITYHDNANDGIRITDTQYTHLDGGTFQTVENGSGRFISLFGQKAAHTVHFSNMSFLSDHGNPNFLIGGIRPISDQSHRIPTVYFENSTIKTDENLDLNQVMLFTGSKNNLVFDQTSIMMRENQFLEAHADKQTIKFLNGTEASGGKVHVGGVSDSPITIVIGENSFVDALGLEISPTIIQLQGHHNDGFFKANGGKNKIGSLSSAQLINELQISGIESIHLVEDEIDGNYFTSQYAAQEYRLNETDRADIKDVLGVFTDFTITNNATFYEDDANAIWTDNLTEGKGIPGNIHDPATEPNEYKLTIDSSRYVLETEAGKEFANQLVGDGVYQIDFNDHEADFSFTDDAITSDFKGIFNLSSGITDLNNNNTIEKLNGDNATLKVSDQGKAIFDTSPNLPDTSDTLNHLHLDGGTIALNGDFTSSPNYTPPNTVDDRVKPLKVDKLTVSGGDSKIELGGDIIFGDNPIDYDADKYDSFFDQTSKTDIQLVDAETVVDSGGTVKLTGKNNGELIVLEDGEKIEHGKELALNQDGDDVGSAKYDFTGVIDHDGVYFGYALTELKADSNKEITISNSASTKSNTLNADLTGDGGFEFIISSNAVDSEGKMLIGGNNSYKGKTNVTGDGTFIFNTDNAFGQSREITIGKDGSTDKTQVDLMDHTQDITGGLTVESNATLNINSGTLNIESNESQTIKGDLKAQADGKITLIENGDLTIEGSNNQFSGSVDIGNNANVSLSDAAGLGDGIIKFSATDSSEHADVRISHNQSDGILRTQLNGEGHLHLDGTGSTTIQANNENFKGQIDISDDHSIRVTNAQGIGKGDVVNEGTFILDIDSQTSLWGENDDNSLQGDGQFIKQGMGDLRLNDDNKFQQKSVSLKEGRMIVGYDLDPSTSAINPDTFILDTEELSIDAGTTFIAKGNVDIAKKDATGAPIQDSGSVVNRGHIYLGGAYALDKLGNNIKPNDPNDPAHKEEATNQIGSLTIHGNYEGYLTTTIGNNDYDSMIHFGGNLGDDQSEIDTLIIKGDLLGTGSYVDIRNIQGIGQKTDHGIDLITVEGSGQSGFFALKNGVVEGGAYLYTLVDRNNDGTEWYLDNDLTALNPNWNGGGGTNPPTTPPTPVGTIAPHASAYLATLAANNELFALTLHDRNYYEGSERVWGRMDGHFGKSYDNHDQNEMKTDSFVLQMGVDLYQHQTANLPLTFGMMAGYGHTKTKVTNRHLTGAERRAEGKGDGWSIGGYMTYGDAANFYVDSTLQYVYFSNRIEASYLAHDEKYKSKGFLASIEVGNRFQAMEGFYIQPQGQLTWMGVKQDTHHANDGSKIHGNKDNIQLRLGARFTGEYNPDGLNPYGELNYIHNTKEYTMNFNGNINSPQLRERGARNQGQIKVGVNGHISQDLSLWGEISHSRGSNSYRNSKISAGMKFEF